MPGKLTKAPVNIKLLYIETKILFTDVETSA